jgi:hypothetical protein
MIWLRDHWSEVLIVLLAILWLVINHGSQRQD